MAGVEPALLELLVIFGSLRAQTQEAGQQLLFTGLLALNQKRPSVIGMFEVAVPFVGTDMLGDGLILVIESQPVRIDLGGQSRPGPMRRDGVTIGLPQHTEATVDG